jgi:hypothetical protein
MLRGEGLSWLPQFEVKGLRIEAEKSNLLSKFFLPPT